MNTEKEKMENVVTKVKDSDIGVTIDGGIELEGDGARIKMMRENWNYLDFNKGYPFAIRSMQEDNEDAKREITINNSKVGVGTGAPDAKLQVNGDLMLKTNDARLRLMRGDTNYIDFNSDAPLFLRSISDKDTMSNVCMVLKNDGRVGIGTNKPEATLHVEGTLRIGNITISESMLMALLQRNGINPFENY